MHQTYLAKYRIERKKRSVWNGSLLLLFQADLDATNVYY